MIAVKAQVAPETPPYDRGCGALPAGNGEPDGTPMDRTPDARPRDHGIKSRIVNIFSSFSKRDDSTGIIASVGATAMSPPIPPGRQPANLYIVRGVEFSRGEDGDNSMRPSPICLLSEPGYDRRTCCLGQSWAHSNSNLGAPDGVDRDHRE